jgi:DNA polymerase family B/DNA polymerase family B, exonuclease domain
MSAGQHHARTSPVSQLLPPVLGTPSPMLALRNLAPLHSETQPRPLQLASPPPAKPASTVCAAQHASFEAGVGLRSRSSPPGALTRTPTERPPSSRALLATLHQHHLSEVVHATPYFSRVSDQPAQPIRTALRTYRARTTERGTLPLFAPALAHCKSSRPPVFTPCPGQVSAGGGGRGVARALTPARPPPSPAQCGEQPLPAVQPRHSHRHRSAGKRLCVRFGASASTATHTASAAAHTALDGPSQLEFASLDGSHLGLAARSEKAEDASTDVAGGGCGGAQLTLLSVEVHANTAGGLLPDPTRHPLTAIYCALHQQGSDAARPALTLFTWGVHAQADVAAEERRCAGELLHCRVRLCRGELATLDAFVEYVRACDPDFVVGYELCKQSVGWLVERAEVLGVQLDEHLSRLCQNAPKSGRPVSKRGRAEPPYLPGRILLDVWSLMRKELALRVYTAENVAYHVLGRRVPHLSAAALSALHRNPRSRWRVHRHHLERVQLNLTLLERVDLVGRTAELARVFGMDFTSVLSRGSQFRVESVLLRLTKSYNYLLYSPSRHDVANQRTAECLPLVMEPRSDFYTSPVLVLDFQSLYPTIMIAYNLCYSTCAGSVRDLDQWSERLLGVTSFALPPGLLSSLGEEHLRCTSNEVVFAERDCRVGILPRMLEDLLRTRIMVKCAMKRCKNDPALIRMLNARQLGLKLLCNVTYGYAGASFSGRMPCIELADAIVQTARDTLLRAKRLVEEDPDWKASVVYGDTGRWWCG